MVPVAVIGERVDLTYDYKYLGAGPDSLGELKAGHPAFDELSEREAPADHRRAGRADAWRRRAVLNAVSASWRRMSARLRTAGTASACCTRRLAVWAGWISASCRRRAARMSPGIIAGAQSGEIKTVLLLGADEIDTSKLGSAKVIYVGSHGDNGAHRADVILPARPTPRSQRRM
jgi:NADH-quinone oxidoreductase subunit G